MDYRRCLAVMLLVGFCLLIQGRLEPDFASAHHSEAFHAADLTHPHDDTSRAPLSPAGPHKDQHGCYHSHAPFILQETAFNFQAQSTALVTTSLETPNSLALTSILRPPRA